MELKLNQGPISETDLMDRLAKAKKVMHKVDNGDYHKGNISESQIVDDTEAYEAADKLMDSHETVPLKDVGSVNIGTMQEDRINQSKLPDAIKKAMIDNPTQISLNDSVSMDFVERTKKIMEKYDGTSTKKTTKTQPRTNQPSQPLNNSDLVSQLTPIIENIVIKAINDIFDKKLDLILNAQQTATINENLVLKVGESIFSGKITGVKKTK